ncbi:MAG: hypothetical protein JJT94_07725 [Bernardetiaceae bacterium]|nr:hypothetical protein [Bernardetiaceae bacterium]
MQYQTIQFREEGAATYRVSKSTEHDICLLELIGKMEFEFYKNMWLQFLNLAVAHKVKKLIIDTSQLRYSSSKGRAWLITSYVRKANKALPDITIIVVQPKNKIQRLMIQVIFKSISSLSLTSSLYGYESRQEAELFFSKPTK